MKKRIKLNDFRQCIKKVSTLTLMLLFFSMYCADMMALGVRISGKVTNTFGEPVPGVTVIVKGTTNGTPYGCRRYLLIEQC